MPQRNKPACAPGHECTDEEINAVIKEHFTVAKDDSVIKYDTSTIADLKQTLATAATYTGDWYHTSVSLNMDEADPEYVALREKIKQLPPEAGVKIYYSYAIDWATEEKLKKIFNQKLSTIEELNNIPAGKQASPATSTK